MGFSLFYCLSQLLIFPDQMDYLKFQQSLAVFVLSLLGKSVLIDRSHDIVAIDNAHLELIPLVIKPSLLK